jgi:hypothetical protein
MRPGQQTPKSEAEAPKKYVRRPTQKGEGCEKEAGLQGAYNETHTLSKGVDRRMDELVVMSTVPTEKGGEEEGKGIQQGV